MAIIKVIFWGFVLYLLFRPKKTSKEDEQAIKSMNTQQQVPFETREIQEPLVTAPMPMRSINTRQSIPSKARKIQEASVDVPVKPKSRTIKKHCIVDEPIKTPTAGAKLSKLQQDTFNLIENSNKNVFIQGQAGTGKSTFIDYLRKHSNKRILVACPTAVAAINIGGETLHSLFKLPPGEFLIIDDIVTKPRRALASLLQKTDLLIIDEVSMVRPDVLDAVDALSRIARCNKKLPFGGLQILLVGDLCQLPPVITQNAFDIFKQEYGLSTPYFFDSKAYKEGGFEKVEFSKVYRQSDKELLDNLINIRNNKNLSSAVEFFNQCKIRDKDILDNAITITPYRSVADQINEQRLDAISGQKKTYECRTTGTFSEARDAPAPRILTLKKGALVVFNKNNGSVWINGTSGIVESLEESVIKVRILKTNEIVNVKREEWTIYKYEIDNETSKIYEKVVGTFTQFPLQLGYALTIHKAQGKTLDNVIIDIDRGAFAHGQLYVALSRTRKKEDIHVKKRISANDIIQDEHVLDFLDS